LTTTGSAVHGVSSLPVPASSRSEINGDPGIAARVLEGLSGCVSSN
jgi:hypothetical protein